MPHFQLRLGPRLIIVFMVVVLFAVSIPTSYQITYLFNRIYSEAELKMSSDLEIAGLVFDKKESELLRIARTLSHHEHIARVLNYNMDPGTQEQMIKGIGKNYLSSYTSNEISFLTIVNKKGDVIFRSENELEIEGHNAGDDPFIRTSLSGDEVAAFSIMNAEQLWEEGLLKEMPAETPAVNGLVLRAAVPIFLTPSDASRGGKRGEGPADANAGAVGAVIVGFWLNRDESILREIHERTGGTAGVYTMERMVRSTDPGRRTRLPADVFSERATVKDRIRNDTERGEIAGYFGLHDTGGNIIAVLELRNSTELIMQDRRDLLKNIILGVILGLMFAVMLGMFMTRRITGPILGLSRGTEEIGRGNLGHRIHVPGGDELSQLAEGFNVMAIRLQQSMEDMKLSKRQVEEYSNRLKAAHASLEMYSRELEKVNQQLLDSNIKLQKANEVKDTFLSTVSHELKTPLTTIIGYVSMMLEGVLGHVDEEQKQALAVVLRRGRNLQDLIADLLSLSRLDAGRMELRRRYLDLAQELRNVEEVFHERLRESGLQILLGIPDRIPRVNADSERLAQILFNLVGNAIKFTPENGAITIRVSHPPDAGHVIISVADTGIGIPESELGHIFERFYQVDRRDGREFPGTGLGLAISKELVELHGGRIWVESREGRGSTFSFTLPLN